MKLDYSWSTKINARRVQLDEFSGFPNGAAHFKPMQKRPTLF